jgi:predicted P-loop ATPase
LKLADLGLSDQDFKTVCYSSKLSEAYDPFKTYLYSLDKWDGKTDYIKNFLQQVYLKNEEDRQYFVDGFKKWFTALVVSLLEDVPSMYFINQTCLVLSGGQGKYKTTFLQSLVPKELQLKYFYGSSFQVHNKDHEKYLAYKIIINFDEMAAFNKTDIESLKAKITQSQVVLRLPYGKADVHLKRRASFTATQNNKEFLRDDTGSRRWFVIEVENIALDPSANIDNLYKQALGMYREGFQYWFDNADIKKLEAHNEQYHLKGIEEELVLKHLELPTKIQMDENSNLIEYMSATDLGNFFGEKYNKLNVNSTFVKNIGTCLGKLGFQKRSRRLNKNSDTVKLWAIIRVLEPQNFSVDGHGEIKNDIF